jgi:phytoene dehydrogenase-like protein
MTDAVIIGAGANERVAARMLASAGRKVLLIEEHAAPDEETGCVLKPIARKGGLHLKIHRSDPWARAPLDAGEHLELWQDMARSVEAIRRVSPRDAARWPEFCERMARLARLLERLYLAPPPQLTSLGFALKLRRLGRQGMEDFMRLLPMPVAELLDDWFEHDALKGVLGAAGIRNLQQGPRSAGTAFVFLHHHVGSPVGVFRQPRVAVSSEAKARQAKVRQILLRGGRATGVALEGGEEIAAPLVVSGADPRRTLLELADPGRLDPEFARALRNVRARGVVGRVSRAIGLESLVIAPSLDYLERAYDAVKYGQVAPDPYLEVIGEQIHVQYLPSGGWDDARREAFGKRVIEMLLPHAKGKTIEVRSIMGPADLEAAYGWPQGQACQAELALDQALWMRPLPELARYRTPIEGLWLCGAAMHPGGGIIGAAGYNCAGEILRAREGIK